MTATQLEMPTEKTETQKADDGSPDSPSLRLVKEGSRDDFSRLMREHHRELIVFAGAIVSDCEAGKDIVQDALVSAWRKFDEFDPELGDFGAWMRGIIRFKAKDFFRKMQRTPISELGLVEMEVDLAAWQRARAAGTGVFEIVENCLGKLPEKMREAVQRFYLEDRSGDDAAGVLDISPANLRKRLERARGLLHECIAGEARIVGSENG